MKFIKWKILGITVLVCLLPILPGLALWQQLPESIAVHFDMYNNPDNFAPKAFVVFGLPCLMAFLQIICCVINDVNTKKHGERKKFSLVTKWIIPIMAMLLQVATFAYALGKAVDVRRVAMFIVGSVLLVMGNYMPKFDYIKNVDADAETARKIHRFIGFETVLMGVMAYITLFLPPLFSIVWLILLIPYALIGLVYGILKTKKRK